MQEKLLNTVKLQIYLCFKSAMGTAVSYLPHAKTDEVISKTKKVDRSTKHPFPVKIDLDTFSVLLVLIKLLVIVYDVVSTPFYALYMQPWAKRAANRAIRARQEDPTDPYSPYVSAVKVEPRVLEHYLYKAETIAHFQKLTLESNDRKQPALGKRQLFSVSEVLTRTGRKMTKLSLDDHYSWLSLEQVDQTIGHLANGFLTQGVQYQEKVLIFAETRMGKRVLVGVCFLTYFLLSSRMVSLRPSLLPDRRCRDDALRHTRSGGHCAQLPGHRGGARGHHGGPAAEPSQSHQSHTQSAPHHRHSAASCVAAETRQSGSGGL